MRVVGFFGPFDARALVEMTADAALKLVDGPIAPRIELVDAVYRDIAELAERDPDVEGSALAEAAIALAITIASPGTSATAQANCVRELRGCLEQLRDQAPDVVQEDELDRLRRRAAERREGAPAPSAAASPR